MPPVFSSTWTSLITAAGSTALIMSVRASAPTETAVSAFVSFQLFVRPSASVLQDLPPQRLVSGRAVLAGPVRSPRHRRSFLRGILDPAVGTVAPVTGQSSHQLASLARANALIVVSESVTELPEGSDVEVLMLP